MSVVKTDRFRAIRRKITLKKLEKKVGSSASDWSGRCYEIACHAAAILGYPAVYGHYLGSVNPSGYWGNRRSAPFIQHGWVKLPNGMVMDPTRWSFLNLPPELHFGPEKPDYDEGGNQWRSAMRLSRPPPKRGEGNTRSQVVVFDYQAAHHVGMMLGPSEVDLNNMVMTLSIEQVFWIANAPYEELLPHVADIYRALEESGNGAAIPIDNRRRADREAKGGFR